MLLGHLTHPPSGGGRRISSAWGCSQPCPARRCTSAASTPSRPAAARISCQVMASTGTPCASTPARLPQPARPRRQCGPGGGHCPAPRCSCPGPGRGQCPTPSPAGRSPGRSRAGQGLLAHPGAVVPAGRPPRPTCQLMRGLNRHANLAADSRHCAAGARRLPRGSAPPAAQRPIHTVWRGGPWQIGMTGISRASTTRTRRR